MEGRETKKSHKIGRKLIFDCVRGEGLQAGPIHPSPVFILALYGMASSDFVQNRRFDLMMVMVARWKSLWNNGDLMHARLRHGYRVS